MVTFNTEHDIQLAYGDRSDDRAKPKEGNPKLRFKRISHAFKTLV